MKCSYCFSEIPDGSRFCTRCGGPQDAAESTAAENTIAEPTPEDPTREKKRSSILTFGILSMIFSLGTSIPFVGTILAIIGKVKSSGYKNTFGDLDGKAKVGSILSTVALIAGILMTIYLVPAELHPQIISWDFAFSPFNLHEVKISLFDLSKNFIRLRISLLTQSKISLQAMLAW